MPTQSTEHVVARYYQHLNAGDLDEAVALFADDFVGHWGLGSGEGGSETVRAHLGLWYAAAPDMQLEVTHTVTDGDWVASFVVIRGTQTGDFAGIAASGRPFQLGSVDMLRVNEGRITEGWTICDLGALFIAAGAVPALAG
jgi:steroid delta-isomerase-like uncharacterized protein